MPAQTQRTRLRSRVNPAVFGWGSPEFIVEVSSLTALAGSKFLWVAPKPAKLVRVDYVSDTNGGGGAVVSLNKHLAGQTVASSTAANGTTVLNLVTGNLPVDTAVRVPVLNRPLITTGTTEVFARGDKLACIIPATWIGTVTCYLIWL